MGEEPGVIALSQTEVSEQLRRCEAPEPLGGLSKISSLQPLRRSGGQLGNSFHQASSSSQDRKLQIHKDRSNVFMVFKAHTRSSWHPLSCRDCPNRRFGVDRAAATGMLLKQSVEISTRPPLAKALHLSAEHCCQGQSMS